MLRTDEVAWCEIECVDGLNGWFQVTGHRVVLGAGWKHATHVVDGLCMAD